jgi:hypothetical protein
MPVLPEMGKERTVTSAPVDLSKVVPTATIKGDAEGEPRLLREMRDEAVNYLTSFGWCRLIVDSYFGLGVGGVVAVFLFRIEPAGDDVDEWVWVVVGDVPPAYIAVEDAPNPATALDAYIGAMQEWVDAARAGGSVAELIPVNVPPTVENAERLSRRLQFIDEEILPQYARDLEA